MNCLQELRRHYGRDEGYALYRMVMEESFGLTHTDILLGKDSQISEDNKARLDEITCRLLENEPVQYVLGHAAFRGHRFVVRPGVLIPRPETEELVDAALEHCTAVQAEGGTVKVLDIGTGSGCIAVSMALEGCDTTAMDIATDALAIASENAARLGAEVSFVRENILHPSPTDNRWDVIVSNPPYICVGEAADMERNVLDHEPHIALFVPDTDPLLFYRAIASYALSHLNAGGALCLEINRLFHREVARLLLSFGFRNVNIIKDRYGKERIVTALL